MPEPQIWPKRVLIYHTHFWESYLPELPTKDPERAIDDCRNITCVGQYLAHCLEKQGIGAIAARRHYPGAHAYDHSRRLIFDLWRQYGITPYLLDIHRDSERRKSSTTTCRGIPYARLVFVVGKASRYFTPNLQLASYLQARVNQICPNLAKEVLIKESDRNTNGEYNQSLSPRSTLLEIGGVDNSLTEVYRSAAIFLQVYAELILAEQQR